MTSTACAGCCADWRRRWPQTPKLIGSWPQRRAARIDRKSPWVQYNWGLCLQRLGHFGRAIRRYRKAYEASEDWVRSLAQIAECYRLDGQPEKAKEAFLLYLREVPDDDYERVNLGTLYSDWDRYDEAVGEVEKARVVYPRE